MAWPFCGNIYGTVQSQQQNLAMEVTSFTLANRQSVAIFANVYKITQSGAQLCIMPFSQEIGVSQMYQGDNPVVLLPTETLKIQTTGSCDYDFKINNLNASDL